MIEDGKREKKREMKKEKQFSDSSSECIQTAAQFTAPPNLDKFHSHSITVSGTCFFIVRSSLIVTNLIMHAHENVFAVGGNTR